MRITELMKCFGADNYEGGCQSQRSPADEAAALKEARVADSLVPAKYDANGDEIDSSLDHKTSRWQGFANDPRVEGLGVFGVLSLVEEDAQIMAAESNGPGHQNDPTN